MGVVDADQVDLVIAAIALGVKQVFRIYPVAIAPTIGIYEWGVGKVVLGGDFFSPGVFEGPHFGNDPGGGVGLDMAQEEATAFVWVGCCGVALNVLELRRGEVECHRGRVDLESTLWAGWDSVYQRSRSGVGLDKDAFWRLGLGGFPPNPPLGDEKRVPFG